MGAALVGTIQRSKESLLHDWKEHVQMVVWPCWPDWTRLLQVLTSFFIFQVEVQRLFRLESEVIFSRVLLIMLAKEVLMILPFRLLLVEPKRIANDLGFLKDIGRVAVKAYANANKNPNAHMKAVSMPFEKRQKGDQNPLHRK